MMRWMNGLAAYVTGASAGLGRALAQHFSRQGAAVGLIGRDAAALRDTAATLPGRCAWAAADVSVAAQLADAADALEAQIGPPDIWINNAMATIFARFADISPEEFAQAMGITCLGSVHGLQQALWRMQPRGRGHIIQIGSSLAYRAIPLQAPYCAAKSAIRAVVDSLRCELLHDRSPLHLTMVHMPAMNTPQFDWAARHIRQEPQPIPPIYSTDACARAVVWTAHHPHLREVWVGASTIGAILGNKLMPAFLDHYLADRAFTGQFEHPAAERDRPGNLFGPVHEFHGLKGRFANRERARVFWIGTSERREWLMLGGAMLLAAALVTGLVLV